MIILTGNITDHIDIVIIITESTIGTEDEAHIKTEEEIFTDLVAEDIIRMVEL